MNLCDDGHDEVCYEGRHCPCCKIIADKDEEISSLGDQISTLEGEVSELKNEIAEKGE